MSRLITEEDSREQVQVYFWEKMYRVIDQSTTFVLRERVDNYDFTEYGEIIDRSIKALVSRLKKT